VEEGPQEKQEREKRREKERKKRKKIEKRKMVPSPPIIHCRANKPRPHPSLSKARIGQVHKRFPMVFRI